MHDRLPGSWLPSLSAPQVDVLVVDGQQRPATLQQRRNQVRSRSSSTVGNDPVGAGFVTSFGAAGREHHRR